MVYQILFLITAMAFIWFWLFPVRQSASNGHQTISGTVRYVVDGDTLYIKGYKQSVRLWGINAPEVNEPNGDKATKLLKRIALNRRVTCHVKHIDAHKRIVGRCILSDGRDIGYLMIQHGLAVEVRRFSKGYYSQ